MTANLFSHINNMLRDSESVNVKATRMSDGQLKLLIQPLPGEVPEGAGEQEQQARAALAEPLMVTRSTDELDGDFLAILARFANQRAQLGQEVEALERLRQGTEAAKQGQRSASDMLKSSGAKAGTAPEPDADKSPQSAGDGEAAGEASDTATAADSDSLV
jgi:PRTRC genetic system protein E